MSDAAAGSAGGANNRSRREGVRGQNTRAGHLREDQTWSERHGIERQTPATCFATPTFLFAEPALTADAYAADLKVGITNAQGPAKAGHYEARLKSRPTAIDSPLTTGYQLLASLIDYFRNVEHVVKSRDQRDRR